MRRLLALVIAVVLLSGCSTPAPFATPESSTAELGEEQQHEGGSVTVGASWIVGTSAARVGLDTHSVDLDGFDLKDLARVRLDGGQWVRPTTWDAPAGGHHRSGTLTFGTLDPQVLNSARVIEVEIQNVAVPSHLLRWERVR